MNNEITNTCFHEISELIQSARLRAYRAVNSELVTLYWQVGEIISRKVESDGWGKGTIESLSGSIRESQPGIRGFSAQNLWKMRQLYEVYGQNEVLSALLIESYPLAEEVFKDSYSLEFLGLSETHNEADLHGALLRNLGHFLTELGRDFCYIGSEYLGKLNFYLEALDRDHRKPHENPAVGILLCATKDEEVVEYALSRSLSPSMVSEYQTQMPDKKLLQAKLHEFYQQLAPLDEENA